MKEGRVWTAHGLKDVEPNGVAQKGESRWNPSTNSVQYIDKGKEGVDDQLVNVQDETFIPSNQLGLDRLMEPYAKHISKIQDKMRKVSNEKSNMDSLSKQTQRIQQKNIDRYIDQTIRPIADLQESIHAKQNETKFEGGKNVLGAFGRMFPSLAGVGASLGQLAHWGTNKIQYHNTYAENPYGVRGLNELNKLRYNPYPEIQASHEAERRAAYANEQAGGLTGGQKYLGRIALGIGGMRNAADVYSRAQQQNNAYRTQYANALLQEGNSVAQRRQQASQHDWADYVAAHGAKTKGIEQATANLVGQIAGAYQNEFKYKTWQDTLKLYQDNQKLDRDRLNADIEESKAKRAATQTVPTYTYNLNNPWNGYLNAGVYNWNPLGNIQLTAPTYQWKRNNCGKDRKR